MKSAQKITDWRVALWCIAVLVGGNLLGTGKLLAAESAPTRSTYTFPFTSLSYGTPAVQVKINDRVIGTLLIDTGSTTNFITDTMVTKLGLKPQPVVEGNAPFLLEGKPATLVSNLKLQIGTLTLQGGGYFIVSAKNMTSVTGSPAVDGIISMQMLRYFAIDMDFSRHQIIMYIPNGLWDDEVRQAGFGTASNVPLISSIPDSILYDPVKASASSEAFWGLFYSVPVGISDGVHTTQQNLVLDTGSAATILSSEVFQVLNLKRFGTVKRPSIEGEINLDTTVVPDLTVSDLHFFNHAVGVYHPKAEKVTRLLGLDVLSNYHILIDFGAKKMYLKPNVSLPTPTITIKPAPSNTPSRPLVTPNRLGH